MVIVDISPCRAQSCSTQTTSDMAGNRMFLYLAQKSKTKLLFWDSLIETFCKLQWWSYYNHLISSAKSFCFYKLMRNDFQQPWNPNPLSPSELEAIPRSISFRHVRNMGKRGDRSSNYAWVDHYLWRRIQARTEVRKAESNTITPHRTMSAHCPGDSTAKNAA